MSVTILYLSTLHDICAILAASLNNLRAYKQPDRPKVIEHCEVWTFSVIHFMSG